MHADVRTFAVQDETYFRDSYKGCRKGTMPRPARKSGREAAKRGLSKQQVCVLTFIHLSPVRITTIMLGNGAGPPGMPFVSNRSLPLRNLTSARLRMNCWNQRVSVRAGRSMTTRVPLRLASMLHLRTHSAIALPYGGLQNTVSPPPCMIECAVFGCIVFLALVVRRAGSRVQSEVKFVIQLGEQVGWRLPVHAVRHIGGSTGTGEIAHSVSSFMTASTASSHSSFGSGCGVPISS